MWMTSHPSRHTKEELSCYDAVLVASGLHARSLRDKLDIPVIEFLQAGDTRHFTQATDKKHFDVVFVGINSGTDPLPMRKAVVELLPTKHNLAVWGKGWEGKLPAGVWKGEFLPWEQLHTVYSMSRIVLNEHHSDMRENGFINNQTYDAASCGTVVVSDKVAEMEKVIGVPSYEGPAELKKIIDDLLADDDHRNKIAD